MDDHEVKAAVRRGYAEVARTGGSCCGPESPCGCGGESLVTLSESLGYRQEELAAVPEGANLGLGCGNPTALAELRPGETVLDLGSGAGFDCFLAAGKVGREGKVIGVDMTPEMIERARANARKGGYANVEFRLGELDHLPVADNSVDVAISNCVINLAPDKRQVFAETYRVLRPGGRFLVSDLVLLAPLPDEVRESVRAYVGCVGRALLKEEYLASAQAAGFSGVEVAGERRFPVDYLIGPLHLEQAEAARLANTVVSLQLRGVKPRP